MHAHSGASGYGIFTQCDTGWPQESQNYQPKFSEDNRWKAKEALEICQGVISEFPKSNGAEKCETLKSQIEYATFQITAEDFLPIQTHSKVMVSYKNLNALQFKIYGISENEFEKFSKIYRKEDQLKFIKKLDVSEFWDSQLKNEGDYQLHTTEVLVPKLDNGRYVILATQKDDENVFGFASIQVTNLALLETETPNHKIFQIINRNNGSSVPNAKVELSFSENNNKTRKQTHTPDAHGQIKIEKSDDRYRNIKAKVTNGNDFAHFGDYYINRHYTEREEETNYKAFVFTDRSIYRPEQTVYFKAIVVKSKENKSEVLASEKVSATLFNVNGEEVTGLELVTNEFGSVSGEFFLPNSGLTGQYHIELNADKKDLNGSQYFSVEEYKRPKFETKFEPVNETYKVNDSVTVKGNALAYAGSNITNAKVVYRVHRKVQYPRWYFWYRPWFNSEPQEITNGESITNEKGEFEITFKAMPDQSVDKSSLPIFNFEITADVTDLNGETRSATTTVNVGYHALVATMDVDALLDKTQNFTESKY